VYLAISLYISFLYLFLHFFSKIIWINGIREAAHCHFLVHVLTRSGYRELGLELVSLEENHSRHPKWPPMEEEKRDVGVEDPIKMFLVESLTQ
jgi:hypothetical protein